MAINYDKGQVPKGTSNSNGLAQTPGTQATAMQNVNTGANINPNMPRAPQVAKQSRSDYQRSLGGMAPPRAPMPTQTRPTSVRRPVSRPVVSRGLPMDQSRGYNIFSGMDANEISGMNQNMGLSNMTALPALAPAKSSMPAVDPAMSGFGLSPGRQMQARLMSEEAQETEGSSEEDKSAMQIYYNPQMGAYHTAMVNEDGDVFIIGENGEIIESLGQGNEKSQAVMDAYFGDSEETEETEETGGYDMPTYEQLVSEIYAGSENEQEGFDTEKKQQVEQQLDQKYASILDQLLAGVDRQAAMMGTFGSGAHSTSINNAIATGLQQMADEYANLGLADMQQTEMDFDQKIQNKFAIAGLLKDLESMDDEGVEYAEKFNMASTVSGSILSDAAAYNDTFGSPSFTPALNEIERQLTDELMNASPSEYQQIQNKYESYLTEYMQFVDQYQKYVKDAVKYEWSTGQKQARAKILTNEFLAPLLVTLGIVDTTDIYNNPDYKEYWVGI